MMFSVQAPTLVLLSWSPAILSVGTFLNYKFITILQILSIRVLLRNYYEKHDPFLQLPNLQLGSITKKIKLCGFYPGPAVLN